MNAKKSRAKRKELGFKTDMKTEYRKITKTGQIISSKGRYRKHKKESKNV